MGVAKDTTRTEEDVLSTPLPGENLRMFYAVCLIESTSSNIQRTRDYWAGTAYESSGSRGKALRREGFRKLPTYQPVLTIQNWRQHGMKSTVLSLRKSNVSSARRSSTLQPWRRASVQLWVSSERVEGTGVDLPQLYTSTISLHSRILHLDRVHETLSRCMSRDLSAAGCAGRMSL